MGVLHSHSIVDIFLLVGSPATAQRLEVTTSTTSLFCCVWPKDDEGPSEKKTSLKFWEWACSPRARNGWARKPPLRQKCVRLNSIKLSNESALARVSKIYYDWLFLANPSMSMFSFSIETASFRGQQVVWAHCNEAIDVCQPANPHAHRSFNAYEEVHILDAARFIWISHDCNQTHTTIAPKAFLFNDGIPRPKWHVRQCSTFIELWVPLISWLISVHMPEGCFEIFHYFPPIPTSRLQSKAVVLTVTDTRVRESDVRKSLSFTDD